MFKKFIDRYFMPPLPPLPKRPFRPLPDRPFRPLPERAHSPVPELGPTVEEIQAKIDKLDVDTIKSEIAQFEEYFRHPSFFGRKWEFDWAVELVLLRKKLDDNP